MTKKVAVIGGGASGLVAAISARKNGASVTVYERLERVGKKILSTGNGRCNMTNINAGEKNYHGDNPSFIKKTIDKFWVDETLNFFKDLGVITTVLEEGKVYPYSLQASSVLDVLRFEAEYIGIRFVTEFEAKKVQKKGDGFVIESYSGDKETADSVILATGGRAQQNLGSNGSGYQLAKSFSHKITSLYPALVQIKTDNTYTKALQGIKIRGVAKLFEGERELLSSKGEILFADYGLSGPPIFNISRTASIIKNGKIKLDLMCEYSKDEVIALLEKRIKSGLNLENYFVGMLPKKLGQMILKSSGIAPLSRMSDSLTKKEILAIAEKIKGWSFEVVGTMSWNNAQVTAGGVDVSDVDDATMESRLAKGLFFAGEILDIDGDCGGYNLQWAWSSGYIAGENASKTREG